MAHYIHFRDPTSMDIEKKLEGIPKCPGTCFFIDVINSTDIKYKTELKHWGKRLNNTFNFISTLFTYGRMPIARAQWAYQKLRL